MYYTRTERTHLKAYPYSLCKTLYLLRRIVGQMNVLGEEGFCSSRVIQGLTRQMHEVQVSEGEIGVGAGEAPVEVTEDDASQRNAPRER